MKYKILNFLRQLGLLLLVVWTVVSLVTLLIELVPGDPAVAILGENATPEQIDSFRAKHGLDKPAFFFTYSRDKELYKGVEEFQRLPKESERRAEQNFLASFFEDLATEAKVRQLKWHGPDNRYLNYWRGVVTGDLGNSFRTDTPVLGLILERYPNTIKLAIAAMFIAILIAIPLGVLAGTRKGSLIDNFSSFFALLGISLPTFVIGPFLVYFFAVKFRIFSATGSLYPEDIVLPAVTLGAALSAILTRMVRSSVIEELGEDYVRTARAKGLSERKVIYKHVLKNGLIPVVTILGLQLGVLLAGSIITEKIFAWQGLGLLLLDDGIAKRDYRLVQGCVLVISVTYIFANTLTDWIYRLLDPRIRLS
ncbi:MAG: ABC transporter permease [Acidobacteria bacterium]|nr:ABC transporter permease [Acidobacteriota bacterium]MBK8811332.1 ABC transporter permease [Acidobacteriota bacterium]